MKRNVGEGLIGALLILFIIIATIIIGILSLIAEIIIDCYEMINAARHGED